MPELGRYARALRDIALSPQSRRRFRADVQQSLLKIDRNLDGVRGSPEYETERWNREWLWYLEYGWSDQLAPGSDYPGAPPLPSDPLDLLDFSIAGSPKFALYADRERIEGKRLLEVGCGTASIGKLIARYSSFYLGVDYSTLALKIGRLVSPDNTAFVHFFDEESLRPYFGTIDTAISRYFWIHQNFESARRLLAFIERFLSPGGWLYADFYWPSARGPEGQVLSPRETPRVHYPSAKFAYASDDVRALVEGTPFHVVRELEHGPSQRRYVVLEKR